MNRPRSQYNNKKPNAGGNNARGNARNDGFSRVLPTHSKKVDQGVRSSWHSTHVCIEPDVIMSTLYAHTRRNKSEVDSEGKPDLVVGTLLGSIKNGKLMVEDCFINALEVDPATSQLCVNHDHHSGVLDLKMRSQSTSAGQQKDEVIGMIFDRADFDSMEKLQYWLVSDRNKSKFNSSKMAMPIFVVVDTTLKSGRLEVRGYQRDRNGVMFLECPIQIGDNFPKSVLCAMKEEQDTLDNQNEDAEISAASLEQSMNVLSDTAQSLKASLDGDIFTARQVYNTLCVNPLMTGVTSREALDRVLGDSMALSYLLKLSELQAEIAKKLNTSF